MNKKIGIIVGIIVAVALALFVAFNALSTKQFNDQLDKTLEKTNDKMAKLNEDNVVEKTEEAVVEKTEEAVVEKTEKVFVKKETKEGFVIPEDIYEVNFIQTDFNFEDVPEETIRNLNHVFGYEGDEARALFKEHLNSSYKTLFSNLKKTDLKLSDFSTLGYGSYIKGHLYFVDQQDPEYNIHHTLFINLEEELFYLYNSAEDALYLIDESDLNIIKDTFMYSLDFQDLVHPNLLKSLNLENYESQVSKGSVG